MENNTLILIKKEFDDFKLQFVNDVNALPKIYKLEKRIFHIFEREMSLAIEMTKREEYVKNLLYRI